MSIAEELAKKYHYLGSLKIGFEDAINEALELAAQEAEKFVGKPCVASHVASNIRRLKSPAGPVQRIDTNAAPVDQRRTE